MIRGKTESFSDARTETIYFPKAAMVRESSYNTLCNSVKLNFSQEKNLISLELTRTSAHPAQFPMYASVGLFFSNLVAKQEKTKLGS